MNQVQDSHLLLDSRNQNFSSVWWLVCPPAHSHFQFSALICCWNDTGNCSATSLKRERYTRKHAWGGKNESGPRHCGYGIPLPRELDWPHVHVVLKFQRFKHGSTHLHRGKLAAKAGSICGRHVQNTVGTVIDTASDLGTVWPTQAKTHSDQHRQRRVQGTLWRVQEAGESCRDHVSSRAFMHTCGSIEIQDWRHLVFLSPRRKPILFVCMWNFGKEVRLSRYDLLPNFTTWRVISCRQSRGPRDVEVSFCVE